MDSLQTILFFGMKWNFFHLANIVFFFHSCRKLMVCIVLFITFVWTLSFFSSSSSSYFIISSLFFLSHAVVKRKNFPFSVNFFQGNFLLLYPYMDQGWQKVPSPTLLLWTMLLREGLGFVFHPVDFFLSFVDAEERLPHASAKPLPWHEVWYSLFRVEALHSLWFTSQHRKLFFCEHRIVA